MFHAAGWTFPWANVFAFATQVLDNLSRAEIAPLKSLRRFRSPCGQSITPKSGIISSTLE